jgi:hypothetical protein
MVFKAVADLHHLWYGRRAANRTRNEIMMWIYEKALRRREIVAPPMTSGEKKEGASKSGTQTPKLTMDGQPTTPVTPSTPAVNGNGKSDDNQATKSGKSGKSTKLDEEAKKEKEKRDKEEEEKKEKAAAADLGKVVNLMSTDTRTVETIIHMGYLFYVSGTFILLFAVI